MFPWKGSKHEILEADSIGLHLGVFPLNKKVRTGRISRTFHASIGAWNYISSYSKNDSFLFLSLCACVRGRVWKLRPFSPTSSSFSQIAFCTSRSCVQGTHSYS